MRGRKRDISKQWDSHNRRPNVLSLVDRKQNQEVDLEDLKCPEWATELERKYFDWTVKQLRKLGIISSADLLLITTYASACAQLEETTTELKVIMSVKESGLGKRWYRTEKGFAKHPLASVEREAREQIRSIGSELGLTPVARNRMLTKGEEGNDPIERFRKRRSG